MVNLEFFSEKLFSQILWFISCIFIYIYIYLVTHDKDWRFLNKMRKRRDGDNLIEMKRGDPDSDVNNTISQPPTGLTSQTEDVPEASFAQLSIAVQETIPKQVIVASLTKQIREFGFITPFTSR